MSLSAAPVPTSGKKIPWGKLAIFAVVMLGVALLVLRGIGMAQLKEWKDQVIVLLQQAGPFAFFTAMALLPVIGFPAMAFTLTAGPVFGTQLGLPGVLAACAVSLAVNITITYWLARRWFRPLLETIVTRAGYKIPVVPQGDQFELTLLLRITPGPPLFFQNYLLGLAGIPFRTYFFVSWTVTVLQTMGIVIFGDALVKGKGGLMVFGVVVFIAVLLVIHIVRRHYAKRKK